MSDENVVIFPGITKLNMPADQILDEALGQLNEVVILGYDVDGEEYFAATNADGKDVIWLMDRCKHRLMEIIDEQEAG
jgi:hypothetical protein